MAPKRSSHLDDPPAASSSEEAEEASTEEEEEEEEDASDDSEAEESPKKAPTSASKPAESDSDEEESGSDEEDAAVKPLASKPPEEPATPADKPKRARSKVAATPAKRPAESQPSKASKRAKKKDSGDDADEPKKSGGGDEKKLFQRVFSEEDEIVILKGMVDYIANNGSLPSTDMGLFHDFIKKSLNIDFTKVQLADKIRRLKRKFETNKKKKVEPSKPIEKKAFDLSKKIWGESSVDEAKPNGTPVKAALKSALKSNGKNLLSSPTPAKETEKVESDGNCGGSGGEITGFDKSLPEYIVKQGLGLVPADKKAELEAKWKEIHMAEFELYVKRTQLISEHGKLVLDALKSSD